MQTAIREATRDKSARIEHYPVVPFSGMSEMQNITLDKYPNLSSYISGRTRAYPSISDAVALILLNQFLSIPVDFYSQEPYTRPQRVFSRGQLDEFLKSMRVLELTFTDGYPDWDSNGGRAGSFRAKTMMPPLLHRNPIGPPSSYPDLYGQVMKLPPRSFDLVFLSYKKSFIPDRKALEEELVGQVADGKYRSGLEALTDELYAQLLAMPKDLPGMDTAFDLVCEPEQKACASKSFFALAARFENASIKIPPDVIVTIMKLGELCATIESEARSLLHGFPVDPKGLIDTIAKHVGSKGALIVSGDTCEMPPDMFWTIRSFQDGRVVLYQKAD